MTACEHRERPKRSRFQFSLKTLLVLTTLLAVFLSGLTSDWWRYLSAQDYEILSVALRPCLSRTNAAFSIVARDTTPISELLDPELNTADVASAISDLKDETLRSFIRNNQKSYVIRRRLARDLRYEIASPGDNEEVEGLYKSQGALHLVYVSRPGVDDAQEQAIVFVHSISSIFSTGHNRGELILLAKEGGGWRIVKRLGIVELYNSVMESRL